MEVRIIGDGLLEIVWDGLFDESATELLDGYLSWLDAYLADRPRQLIHLLHDVDQLRAYTAIALSKHAKFALRNRERLGRIAVTPHSAMIWLGVQTVKLWQPRPIENFRTRDQALVWLEGLRVA